MRKEETHSNLKLITLLGLKHGLKEHRILKGDLAHVKNGDMRVMTDFRHAQHIVDAQ